jgi:signal transduction histidine kinase
MQNVLKRSGAKVTDLFEKQFFRSRWTLAFVYVIILVVVLFSSGGITRFIFSHQLENRFNRFEMYNEDRANRVPPPRTEDVRGDLLETTLAVNGLLLIVAGVLSYWFAGLTMRPIKEAYKKQRQFLSDASHELRTPLAILQTNIENELDATKSPIARDSIVSNLEEIKRMGALIDDLLVLSRLDARNSTVEDYMPVDLYSLVRETVERLKPIATKHGISILFEELDDFKLSVMVTDRELLARALMNVINNAIVYNKEAGSVSILILNNGRTASIIVEDTGVGIERADVEKVFDRFYRAEKSRSRQTGGSGLGLSITKSVVESHGGSIKIKSVIGEGTTVEIVLSIA